jgi:hypothetical protein
LEEGDDILPTKAHINTWIKSLPKFLQGEVERLDMVINYFLIHIKDHFLKPHKMLHPVSINQLMVSFTLIFESQLFDYSSPKYQYPKWQEILRGFKNNDKVYNWGKYVLPDEDEVESVEIQKHQTKDGLFESQ